MEIIVAALIGAASTIASAWIVSRPRRETSAAVGVERHPLRIGGSLAVIAAGAILIFGTTAEVSGLDTTTIGYVLFIIGLIAAAFALIFRAR